MNRELPDVQTGFRKGRETRDRIASIHWIIKKARVPEKHLFLLYWLRQAFNCVDNSKMWKILQEMGIPDCLTCLLRNLYASQESTVRTGHGTTDWLQIRKEVHQAVYYYPAYLTYMQSTSWEMMGWRKHKLESRLLGEISITSDRQMTPHYSRTWRRTKEPLEESERGEWKSWLKVQHLEN